jgi:hypothetical protein
MACDLTDENPSKVDGLTLWGSSCSRQTCIYFPRKEMISDAGLNIILWFHGWYVSGFQEIFHFYAKNDPDGNGDARLRQSVHDSKQNAVLVAPFLGFVPSKPSKEEIKKATTPDAKAKVDAKLQKHKEGANTYAKAELGLGKGNNCFQYLQDILKAIGSFRDKSSGTKTVSAPPALQNLFLACHSGGGEGMLDVLGSLGDFKDKLKECWGFDCIYSTNYAAKAASNPKVKFYLYFGQGSSFDSTYDLYAKRYGTPKDSAASGMDNVFLAPAPRWPGVDDDTRAFQTVDAIKKKPQTAPTYEEFRQELDAWLGNKGDWTGFLDRNLILRGHYTVPATLLEPRIRQSIAKLSKP